MKAKKSQDTKRFKSKFPPRIKSEIYISPDGKVTITDLPPELLEVALSLNPFDKKFAHIRKKMGK